MRIPFFLLAALLMNSALHAVPPEMEKAWDGINSEDAKVRTSSREFIEAQPVGEWLDRALLERRTWAALEMIRGVCNKLPAAKAGKIKPHLCEMLTTLPLEQMSETQLSQAVELTKAIFQKLGAPTEDERRQMLDLWKHIGAKEDVPEKVRPSIGHLLEWLKK